MSLTTVRKVLSPRAWMTAIHRVAGIVTPRTRPGWMILTAALLLLNLYFLWGRIASSYVRKGDLAGARDEYDAAIRSYETALSLASWSATHARLADALAAQAMKLRKDRQRETSGDATVGSGAARFNAEEQRIMHRALSEARRAVAMTSEEHDARGHAYAHCVLGSVLSRNDEWEEALPHLREARDWAEGPVRFRYQLAWALLMNDKRDSAIEECRTAFRLGRSVRYGARAMVSALYELGRLPQAIDLCQGLLVLDPGRLAVTKGPGSHAIGTAQIRAGTRGAQKAGRTASALRPGAR